MPITTTDLRDFAARAARNHECEAEIRASISRAYYSCFHDSLEFVHLLPPSNRCRPGAKHITHEDLYHRIAEWKVQDLGDSLAKMTHTKSALCRALEASRLLRVKADYSLSERLSPKDAALQIERARQVSRQIAQIMREVDVGPEVVTE